jgi:hypothetical protein
MFAKQIKVITNTDSGQTLGNIASGITYLFGAMAIYIGLVGAAIGCCFTKCPKLAKVCACIVSNQTDYKEEKERKEIVTKSFRNL